MNLVQCAAFGLAGRMLKHYMLGDAYAPGRDEVLALVNGERLDVRR